MPNSITDKDKKLIETLRAKSTRLSTSSSRTNAYNIDPCDKMIIRCPICLVPINIHNSKINLLCHLKGEHANATQNIQVQLYFVKGPPAFFTVQPCASTKGARVKPLVAPVTTKDTSEKARSSLQQELKRVAYRPLGFPKIE